MSSLSPEQFPPERRATTLTRLGAHHYAQMRKDGMSHEEAFDQAKFSYGVKPGKP